MSYQFDKKQIDSLESKLNEKLLKIFTKFSKQLKLDLYNEL